jgi:hypothetical protein
MDPTYLEIYNLESYLLDTVRLRFQQYGVLSAFDFFCIVIWKANRAKTKIANRLLIQSKTQNLDEAVRQLTSGLFSQKKAKDRLFYLLDRWGFLLPMASAILTILYPEEFTVYDIRVCNELGGFQDLANITNFERLWSKYKLFCESVKHAAPDGLSLRDKDRYLWGKSFSRQLQQDISDCFKHGNHNDN